MNRKRVLVTGATGFLGFKIVEELIKSDYLIRGFAQNGMDSCRLDALKVEVFQGDLLNLDDIEKSVEGCQIIIHVAAMTDLWPNRSKTLWKVNYDATRNLIETGKKNHIERFIHIGSASSFGYGTKENPGTEKTPYEGYKYRLDYLDSKKKAQDLLIQEARENSFPAVVLNPTFMLGGDCSLNGSNKLILAVYNKSLPGYTSGGKNYVYVKDVARAVVNAIDKGKNGEAYILGHENLSFKEIFYKIAEVTESQCPSLYLPNFAVKTYGLISSFFGRLFGKAPTVSYPMSKISCDGHYFSPQKAVKELDMPQTPIELAIKEAFEYFKETRVISN